MQNESITLKVTPAGKYFMRFLAALNSADQTRMTQFIEESYAIPQRSTADLLRWYQAIYAETNGLEIYKVYLSQEYYIIVITMSSKDGSMYMTKLKITDERPYQIIEHFHEASQVAGK